VPRRLHIVEQGCRPAEFRFAIADREAVQPLPVEGLFFGLAFFVLSLAISAARRREPYRLGELGLAIVLSLFLQIGNRDLGDWSAFLPRLLLAIAFVLAASWSVRRLVRRVWRTS
jgi:hypothetical protein